MGRIAAAQEAAHLQLDTATIHPDVTVTIALLVQLGDHHTNEDVHKPVTTQQSNTHIDQPGNPQPSQHRQTRQSGGGG